MTKALEIISRYSKMGRKIDCPVREMKNADRYVCVRKYLAEKSKKLIDRVKKADIYIDYPVISFFMDMD